MVERNETKPITIQYILHRKFKFIRAGVCFAVKCRQPATHNSTLKGLIRFSSAGYLRRDYYNEPRHMQETRGKYARKDMQRISAWNFTNYLTAEPAYSFICDTQFPSFEESTAAIVAAFFFICPAPCPPCNRCAKSLGNCITRQSVRERDNISHARAWHTTKFLAEIYKGRQPGINLARTGTRGKPCFLAFGCPLG